MRRGQFLQFSLRNTGPYASPYSLSADQKRVKAALSVKLMLVFADRHADKFLRYILFIIPIPEVLPPADRSADPSLKILPHIP